MTIEVTMERRSKLRYMCADLVKVQILDAEDNGEAVANLEDISVSGACLNLDRPVRKGVELEIICSKCRLRGKVRHCRFVQIGWDVEVEFERGNTWDPKSFRPKHLLKMEVSASRLWLRWIIDPKLNAAARIVGRSVVPRP